MSKSEPRTSKDLSKRLPVWKLLDLCFQTVNFFLKALAFELTPLSTTGCRDRAAPPASPLYAVSSDNESYQKRYSLIIINTNMTYL